MGHKVRSVRLKARGIKCRRKVQGSEVRGQKTRSGRWGARMLGRGETEMRRRGDTETGSSECEMTNDDFLSRFSRPFSRLTISHGV